MKDDPMRNPYVSRLGYIALAVTALGVVIAVLLAVQGPPYSSPSDPSPIWPGAALGVLWLAVKAITWQIALTSNTRERVDR